MAFTPANLKLLNAQVGGGPNIWYYSEAAGHATIEAAGYFAKMGAGTGSDNTTRGMKVGDILYHYKTNATIEVTIHVVTTVSAAGDVTVSAATLA